MQELNNIPKHVAIIMDGNGRWAKERGYDRSYGHMYGVESVRRTIKAAVASSVEYITLYAFSTENWSRPQQEVDALFELLCKSIADETDALVEQGVRFKIIGDKSRFNGNVMESINSIEQRTQGCKKLTVLLALNYSSKSELTYVMQSIAQRVQSGELEAEKIDQQVIEQTLYTAGYPDPDLLIRTGGECRLSNFLLWQASYSELLFMPILWPDFTEESFQEALEIYASRNRTFGKV